MALPPPDGEDDFVEALAGADDDAVLDAIGEALDARRVRLAARLVQLLPEDVDDPAAARARQAARLVLHRQCPERHEDLDEAFEVMRAWRVARARRLERRGLSPVRPFGWPDPWSRRRR